MNSQARAEHAANHDLQAQWMNKAESTVIHLKNKRALPELLFFLRSTLIEATEKKIALSPENHSRLLNEFGLALMYDNRPEEAKAQFDAAISVFPGNVNAAFNKANMLLNSQNAEEALELFSAILQAGNKHAPSAHHAGLCCLALKKNTQALDYFIMAAELDPDSVGANYWAGEILLHSQSYEKSKPYFEKACALNPLFDAALRGLAICNLQTGAYREAIRLCETLEEIDAKNPFSAWLIKGDAYLAMNDLENAVDCHGRLALLDFEAREHPVARAKELYKTNPAKAEAYALGIIIYVPELTKAFRGIITDPELMDDADY